MFGKSLFNTAITPMCEYCSNGRRAPDGEQILCKRTGIVQTNYKCSKFDYDPLKRTPKRRPRLPEFSADDFKL